MSISMQVEARGSMTFFFDFLNTVGREVENETDQRVILCLMRLVR